MANKTVKDLPQAEAIQDTDLLLLEQPDATRSVSVREVGGHIAESMHASNIAYDNTASGLDAQYVNTAIDEILTKMGGIAKVESWSDMQKIVRLGLAPKVFSIGDQLECNHARYGKLTWDIIGFDCDTPSDATKTHNMTIQLHDLLPTPIQYDAAEALFFAENELPAGTYHFTTMAGYDVDYGGGKTYAFTIANPVPAGGQICFSWKIHTQASESKITTYPNRTATAAIESVPVIEGNGGTNLETIGVCNHTHRVRFGSNNWLQSAIRQFLNSDADAGSAWTPQTNFDRLPDWASNSAGFLNGLDNDFVRVIGNVMKTTARSILTDGGGSETSSEKFFLLSRSEVYAGNENNILEGEPYPYYKDNSDLLEAGRGNDANRIKYCEGQSKFWWIRSPGATHANNVNFVDAGGGMNYYTAFNTLSVAPACCIV